MNSSTSVRRNFLTDYFFYSLIAICLAYLIYEFIFIPYEILAADEFVYLRHIADYAKKLPYLDFSPYKTVLGYYLLLIPLFFAHGILEPLFYIKDEIALINASCILISCYLVSANFDKRAILLTVLAIIANQLFLIYSTELRVEMLAAWCCLFSTLFMMQHRAFLSGILIALAFLISPKSLANFIAINSALFCCHFFRGPRFFGLRSALAFNVAAIISISIYITFWSFIVSPSIIIESFFSGYLQSTVDLYRSIYNDLWLSIFKHGPLLFLIWPLYPLSFLQQKNAISENRCFIFFFANISLIFFVIFFNPLPFNFVFTAPAFFLLLNDFLSFLFSEKTNSEFELQPILAILIGCYSFFLLVIVNIFSYSIIYNLLVILPISILLLLYQKNAIAKFYYLYLTLIIFFTTGILSPLYQSISKSYYLNGTYQQTTLKIVSQLLNKNENYIAGIPFLYQKDQPITGLINLTDAQVVYLIYPFQQFASLLKNDPYLSSASTDEILNDFNHKPIKMVISNLRFYSLPRDIKTYFFTNYKHYYGSIFLYAPTIFKDHSQFKLMLTSRYRIETEKNKNILIDGKKIHSGEIIFLKNGKHLNQTPFDYRLIVQSKIDKKSLSSQFQDENFLNMIKPIML